MYLSFLELLKKIFCFANGYIAPGHVLVREAAEDTVLEIPKPHGQVGTTTIPVPKGVQVSLVIIKLFFYFFLMFV